VGRERLSALRRESVRPMLRDLSLGKELAPAAVMESRGNELAA
jgi:hypothetical protein